MTAKKPVKKSVKKAQKLYTLVTCNSCHGTGATHAKLCKVCDGLGAVAATSKQPPSTKQTHSIPKHVLNMLPSLPEFAAELRAATPEPKFKLTQEMCRQIIGSLLGSLVQLSDTVTVRAAVLACGEGEMWDAFELLFKR